MNVRNGETIDSTEGSAAKLRCLFQSLAPWVVGALCFLFVDYHFYAPQLEGKSLTQGDIAQYAGMSQDIKETREHSGEDPQWTGSMFSGMPAYLIDVEYPEQYVKQTASPIIKAIGSPANMTLWAMMLMMVAVVLMGVNPWIGIVAGLAYGLSTYFFLIIDAGHITKMWALVYAPPLVGSVWYALRRNMWVGAPLAALFGSLELGANHPQITYYFLIVCLALWISELIVSWMGGALRRFAKATALLAVAALLAVGSNLAPLWYTAEHQKYTTRGVSEGSTGQASREEKIAYNTAWSYGVEESLNMLVPNYMGGSSSDVNRSAVDILQSDNVQMSLFNDAIDDLTDELSEYEPGVRRSDVVAMLESGDETLLQRAEAYYSRRADAAWSYAANYWGEQPYTAGPTYLGVVVILLALVSLTLLGWRDIGWVVVATLVAIVMAWGANAMPVYETLYDILPGYKSFRTVSMALVVVEWTAPLMAVMGLWALIRSELTAKVLIRRVAICFGVVVVVVVAMMLAADYGVGNMTEQLGDRLWVEQLKEAVVEGRRAALMADAWRTLLYAAVTTVVLVAFIVMRERNSGSGVARKNLAIGFIAVMGLLIYCDLGGVAERYLYEDKWQAAAPTDIKPTEADRVIMADDDLGFRVLDLSSDPFNSARASYFHRSVGGYHGAKLGRYQEVIDRYLRGLDGNMLAALNTRYVIYDGEALAAEAVTGVSPYGAAWLVDSVVRCDTPAAEIEALSGYSLRNTAIVGGKVEGLADSYSAEGSIELVEYAPHKLKYKYSSATPSFAVFSEVYFPDGWSVSIDGREADYFAVDYILRGMELPAGEHTIEWSFRAPHWSAISTAMGVCAAVVLLWIVVTLLLGKRLGRCENSLENR